MPEYIYSIGGKRYTVGTSGGDVHLEWFDVPLGVEGDSLFQIEEAKKLVRDLCLAISDAEHNRERISYAAYLSGIPVYQATHPDQRFGQAAYNYLYELRPDIARTLNSTNCDPFFVQNDDGETFTRFFNKVQEMW